eukprot:TRINITY_DN342_c0_g1_i2.p1 TRINITY_DN342_c0_g1~~TRINITY_DN342_c0_g1_i2.p1  ORF type:complete len:518 (+),score=49.48 TRINITY_DN342_c0_g1_i2:168-1721(+)
MAALLQWLRDPTLNQTTLSAFLFASLVLVLVLRHFSKENSTNYQRKRKPNLPPGPLELPIIGNLHQLGSMPHYSLRLLSQKLGPIIYLKLGQIPTVVVSSARTAKEVMTTHDLALSSRPRIYSAKHLLYNCTDIGFSPYGAYWRHLRKICVLELLSVKRVQSYSFAREEEVARLVRRVAELYLAPVNLTKMFGLFASDVLCRIALGRVFSEGGDYDRHGFHKMLEEVQVLLGGFNLGDLFPSIEWVNKITGLERRLKNVFQRFDCFLDEVIKEHLDPKREQEDHKDLVDVLLDIKNSDLDMPLTMDSIKAVLLDVFAAGTHTTFVTLDWGMTELIKNPKVMKRAQAEVRSILGERKSVLESDLNQLCYLKAVIKEIFRLHPPAPLLMPRESIEEVTIDGYDIPTKTRFLVNAWAIGRDPESWGENSEIFEPERFIGNSIDFTGQDFKLLPFGAGRRGCPGITFGTASVEIALAQLLHSFDWELPHDIRAEDLDMTEVFGITMHRIAELFVVAKPHFT